MSFHTKNTSLKQGLTPYLGGVTFRWGTSQSTLSSSLFLCKVARAGSWRHCYEDRVQATKRIPYNSPTIRWAWWVLSPYTATEISLPINGVNLLLGVPWESGQHPAPVNQAYTWIFKLTWRQHFFPAGLYPFFPTQNHCVYYFLSKEPAE